MSTYVLMRLLESAPHRYDRGIQILTFGHVGRAYDRLVRQISPGQRVLDIGCGTGALTLRAAARGASVRGIDRDAEMLAIARERMAQEHLEDRVELADEGVAELDAEPAAGYDVVMSGLCFSELSPDELRYTLTQVRRMLQPGGLLLVADEVLPSGFVARLFYRVVRAPMVVLTYLLTQQTTHAARRLADRLNDVGLAVIDEQRSLLGSFTCLVARRQDDPAAPAAAT
jgi:demethylmenaquinone methyltransferase/2-methoxy-6-polyprenyl-1,4-benzoquinol methylase